MLETQQIEGILDSLDEEVEEAEAAQDESLAAQLADMLDCGLLSTRNAPPPPSAAMLSVTMALSSDGALDAALARLERLEEQCEEGMLDAVGGGGFGAGGNDAGVDEGPSELRPGLLVGSIAMASTRELLASKEVTHVLNCMDHRGTEDEEDLGEGEWAIGRNSYDGEQSFAAFFKDELLPCEYLGLPAYDDDDYDLVGLHAEAAHRFLGEARAAGGVCFVHCTAGRNRSVAVAVAHLVLSGERLLEAVGAAASARPHCLSNEGFVRQLVQLARREGRLFDDWGGAAAGKGVALRPLQPGEAALLAEWHATEFGGRDAGTRAADYAAQDSQLSAVPCTVVAEVGGWVAGSCAVVADDLDGQRPDCTPWLASLFVHAAHRKLGAGAALVAKAERVAAELGHARIFLWTPDEGVKGWYQRLGWELLEELANVRGSKAFLMAKSTAEKA